MANATAAQLRKGSKFSARRPALRDDSLPWNAEEDVHALRGSRRYDSMSPPIDEPVEEPYEESEDLQITSSFRAPEDRPLKTERDRSVFSAEDVRIEDLLRETFAKRRYGPERYRLRIEAPEGAGGERQARRSLSLFSRNEGMPVIVCGWVDVENHEAQVRSYGVVAQRHRSRYGAAPAISEEEYERFMSKLMDTLFEGGVRLVLLTPDEHEAATEAHLFPEHRLIRPSVGITFLVVLAFAVGMNVAHPSPWLQQVPGWWAQARVWIEQAGAWLAQVPSWLEAASHLLH